MYMIYIDSTIYMYIYTRYLIHMIFECLEVHFGETSNDASRPGISRGGPSSGDLFGRVHRVSDGTFVNKGWRFFHLLNTDNTYLQTTSH